MTREKFSEMTDRFMYDVTRLVNEYAARGLSRCWMYSELAQDSALYIREQFEEVILERTKRGERND